MRRRLNEVGQVVFTWFLRRNSSKQPIYVYFVLDLFTVTDEEMQRLRLAFKRASGVAGLMVETLFAREVLGDCVPVRVAEVIHRFLSQTILCRFDPFLLNLK